MNSEELTPEERMQIREMLTEWRGHKAEKARADATRLTKELRGKYGGNR